MRHIVNLTSASVLKQTIISLARAKREQIYPPKKTILSYHRLFVCTPASHNRVYNFARGAIVLRGDLAKKLFRFSPKSKEATSLTSKGPVGAIV